MGDVPSDNEKELFPLLDEQLWQLLLLPVGFLAGVVNVLAGGGSFLTLPVLIASGLPIHVANGTNRLSVIVQGLVATKVYKKRGEFDAKLYRELLVPLIFGAVIGAYLATKMDPERLRGAFGLLFLTMAVILLFRSRLKGAKTPGKHPLRIPALILVGLYGGFIQAGVGLWILVSSTSLFGIDALKANAVKLPLTLTFTIPAFLLFLQADMVEWIPGIILALGCVLGTLVGVRLSLRGGEQLIYRCVTGVLVLTGLHLLI